MDANVIPRVLMGTVDGIEIVGVGTLELARNVLLRTVSGAANVGAEALTATTAGARRAVLAAAPKTSRSRRLGESSASGSRCLAAHERSRLNAAPSRMMTRFCPPPGGGQSPFRQPRP